MAVAFNVVHGEKYQQNGQEKTRYTTIGKVIEGRNGGYQLKLDMIPTNWDGWAALFEPDQQNQQPQRQQGQQRQPQRQNGGQQQGNYQQAPRQRQPQQFDNGGLDDDIPFIFNCNTICDMLGKPKSLLRAKHGKGMLRLQKLQESF
ncbi:MAG: single-stranded DNA-binding protein [Podoviridae sp. ctQNx1]|nr:MAG: single-stranded DNA-binding protein [Podoviridae sp. ctQNx1]UOF78126.1 single-stranded DNA-binding protein [Caudoviricetes sp.]